METQTMLITALAFVAFIALAQAGLQALRARHKTPSILDDVLTLARLERRGWRARLGALVASGVPLNVMISENWPTLLLPGLRKIFHTRMRGREELFKRTVIFPVDTSQRAYEESQGIGELGTEGWNFEDTGRVQYDAFRRGFKQRLEHREFAKGVVIERKLMDDNLYPGAGIPRQVNTRVEKLADSAAVKRERSAASVFNNAFTDSGLDDEGHPIAGPDGVGLCSTAHPNGPEDSGTQSNEGTLTLTHDNLIASRLLMRRFKDDRGEQISVHPSLLLVPPELEDVANVIVGSDQKSGTNNNDMNVNRSREQVVSWDYLTDTTAWFLIDEILRDQHLVWYDRIAPEFDSEGDFDTLQAKYRGYMRYSRGFDDWRWVLGQNG